MIVEDGTGKADANSYVSIGFADDYFSARGIPEWDSIEAGKKEQSLIRATDYIDNVFQWNGKKLTPAQSLRFPRSNLRDYEGQEITGVPVVLKQAVCDAAILVSGGSELFQTSEVNGDVVSENITALSFTYSKSERTVTSRTLYDSINTKLRGLYRDGTVACVVSGRVERA